MTNKDILMKFISAQQQKSQPIVSDQGYKNGAPPQGSNWRIPSDTLYNPTPFNIKAVSDNGIEKTLQPFDTTNVEFPGAQYVDEYHMQNGGLTRFLPKAQDAGNVIPADADRYGTNKFILRGDDTQYVDPAKFQQLQELQNKINSTSQSSSSAKQAYEQRVLEAINKIEPQNFNVLDSGYIPDSVRNSEDAKKNGFYGCISGVCYTLNEAGEPVKYYSNSKIQDAAKDGTLKDWALDYDTKNISGGDILQFTGNRGVPHHATLVVPNSIVKNDDGTISFEVFMNNGTGAMHRESYTVDPKNDRADNGETVQLLKRKHASDLDNMVRERDALRAQIEAADPAAFKKGRARRWNTYMPGAFREVGVDYTRFEGQEPMRLESTSMMGNLNLDDAGSLLIKNTINSDIDYSQLRKTAGFENILNQVNDPAFKQQFMKDHNITNREYNAIVTHSFGIYGQESGFGTKTGGIEETDVARKGNSIWQDVKSRFSGEGEYKRDVVDDYSRGLTQVKLRNIDNKYKRKYGIDENTIESDPTKAFLAAMVVNAQNLPQLRKLAASGETDALDNSNYLDFIPYMYNQPGRLRRGDRKTIEAALEEGEDPAQALVINPNSPFANNEYMKNVRTYSDLIKFMPLYADAPNKKMGGELSKYKVGGKIKRKSVDAPTADFDAMNNADKRAEYEAGWKAYSQGADQWSDMLNREEEKKGRELTREEKIAFLEKYVKPADGERKFKYDQANDRRFDFLFNNGYQTWNTESGTPEFVFRKPVTVNEKLNDLDKELQKHAHDWTKREETPFAKSLGFDPNKSDEAKKRAWDYAHSKVGERLIAANPQGDRTRVEWMNSFTPQERHIIEGGQAAYNFEPGFGTQFSSGLEKNVRNLANIAAVGPINWFNGKNEFNTALWGNDDLTKEEQNNANALGILAPLTYSANLARGVVTGDAGRAASGNVAKPMFNGTGMSFVDPTGAAVMSELLTVGMDPLIPISAAAETGALAKGAEAFTELPGINSLYKFNPNAKGSFFKPWEGATRIINQAGYDDAVSNFAIRSAPQGALPAGETLTINGVTHQMSGRPTAWPSFSRKPNPTYLSKGQNNFIVETQHPVALSTKGRHGKGTTLFPVDAEGKYLTQIPIEDTQIYNAKPNWISGYQKAWNNPMDLDMSKLKVTMVDVPQADGSILPVKALADESGKIVSYNFADSGAFNNGVFLHPENPNYVIKAEAPWLTEKEFIPDYSSFNFQDLHKGIISPNIGKIVKQQDAVPRGSNALVNDRLFMTRKMSGKSLDKYSSEQLRNIPMEAYAQLWNDAKQVRNNNLGIDFVGNNIFYDDATSQFKIIDLSPLSDDAIAVDKWNNPILKGQGPGLPTKESANILKQAIGDKLVTLHESADRRLGLPIDQYQSIFHDMYKDKMQNINKMWIQQGMYKRGGSILADNMKKYQTAGNVVPTLWDQAMEQLQFLQENPATWKDDPDMQGPGGKLNLCLDCINVDWKNPEHIKDAYRLIEQGYSMGTHYNEEAFHQGLQSLGLQPPVYNSKPAGATGTSMKALGGPIADYDVYNIPQFMMGGGQPCYECGGKYASGGATDCPEGMVPDANGNCVDNLATPPTSNSSLYQYYQDNLNKYGSEIAGKMVSSKRRCSPGDECWEDPVPEKTVTTNESGDMYYLQHSPEAGNAGVAYLYHYDPSKKNGQKHVLGSVLAEEWLQGPELEEFMRKGDTRKVDFDQNKRVWTNAYEPHKILEDRLLANARQGAIDRRKQAAEEIERQKQAMYKKAEGGMMMFQPGGNYDGLYKDGDYKIDTTTSHTLNDLENNGWNRSLAAANSLGNPNAMAWALPNKGFGSGLKAVAGLASGLSGAVLGYEKLFNGKKTTNSTLSNDNTGEYGKTEDVMKARAPKSSPANVQPVTFDNSKTSSFSSAPYGLTPEFLQQVNAAANASKTTTTTQTTNPPANNTTPQVANPPVTPTVTPPAVVTPPVTPVVPNATTNPQGTPNQTVNRGKGTLKQDAEGNWIYGSDATGWSKSQDREMAENKWRSGTYNHTPVATPAAPVAIPNGLQNFMNGVQIKREGGLTKFWPGGPFDQNAFTQMLNQQSGNTGLGVHTDITGDQQQMGSFGAFNRTTQDPKVQMQKQWETTQRGDSAGFIAANNALNGMGMFNDVLEAKDYEKQYKRNLRNMGNTDAMYNADNPVNPFGSYTPNVGPGSNYSLVTNGFAQDFGTKGVAAKFGGAKQYRQGGTYHVSQTELMYILANGGEIEYL